MESQQQQNDAHEEKPLIHIEGPGYTATHWTVSVSIGPHHKTFHSETEEEAQQQIEQYLDQQIAELESYRTRLQGILGKPKRSLWPDPDEQERWNKRMTQMNERVEQERAKLKAEYAAKAQSDEDEHHSTTDIT